MSTEKQNLELEKTSDEFLIEDSLHEEKRRNEHLFIKKGKYYINCEIEDNGVTIKGYLSVGRGGFVSIQRRKYKWKVTIHEDHKALFFMQSLQRPMEKQYLGRVRTPTIGENNRAKVFLERNKGTMLYNANSEKLIITDMAVRFFGKIKGQIRYFWITEGDASSGDFFKVKCKFEPA